MIKIYNSRIEIYNYKYNNNDKKLHYELSIWNPIYFKLDVQLYHKDDDKMIIPRGYNIHKLKLMYNNHKIIYVDDDKKTSNINIDIQFEPRSETQINAIEFLKETKDRNQKFLCLKTGEGKTFTAINYITYVNKIPFIIVDSSKLLDQWKEEFIKFTDLEADDIYQIAGRKTIEKLMEMDNINYKVYIASIRTLNSYMKDDKYNIDKLLEYLNVGIKVFDEAHSNWETMTNIDMFSNVEETLYLTATPERSDYKEDKIYQKIYGELDSFGIEKKYLEPYHNIFYIEWNSNPDDLTKIDIVNNNYGFNVNMYSDYIEKERYNEFTNIYVDMGNKIFNTYEDSKIAIVLQKNSLVTKVYNDIENFFPDKEIGVFTSLIEDFEDRDRELEKDIIITTSKSFEKGVDVKNLTAILNFVPMSSPSLVEQMCGRLRQLPDKEVMYFDITDTGFKESRRQLKSRRKVLDALSKKNFKIIL